MSADFWAGYLSGAAGIIIGNPLDLIKTRLQAGPDSSSPAAHQHAPPTTTNPPAPAQAQHRQWNTLVKGSAAPVLGYGALNALLFMTYNRSMALLGQDPSSPSSLAKTFAAGGVAGLATFVVSAPTELIKCRVQVSRADVSSWAAAREIWRADGLRGLYWGGGVTALRDSVGYGFYYWSYELSKRALVKSRGSEDGPEWMSVLLCGGIAGVVTWASIFPLDVIKTRVQTQGVLRGGSDSSVTEATRLLRRPDARLDARQMMHTVYKEEGTGAFFRGLGVCSARAFVVNAVQWAVYEWIMHIMIPKSQPLNALL